MESDRDPTVTPIREQAVVVGDWTQAERVKAHGSTESRPTDVSLLQWVTLRVKGKSWKDSCLLEG